MKVVISPLITVIILRNIDIYKCDLCGQGPENVIKYYINVTTTRRCKAYTKNKSLFRNSKQ